MPIPLSATRRRPAAVLAVGRDPDHRSIAGPPELDRVADQVLEHLGELCRVAGERRQRRRRVISAFESSIAVDRFMSAALTTCSHAASA